MIAVAVCSHVPTCSPNKAAQVPLTFYWSTAIISCFGIELDSWGCCLHVTLLGGNPKGKQAAGYANSFICTAAHYQSKASVQKSTKHTARAGSWRASMMKGPLRLIKVAVLVNGQFMWERGVRRAGQGCVPRGWWPAAFHTLYPWDKIWIKL